MNEQLRMRDDDKFTYVRHDVLIYWKSSTNNVVRPSVRRLAGLCRRAIKLRSTDGDWQLDRANETVAASADRPANKRKKSINFNYALPVV